MGRMTARWFTDPAACGPVPIDPEFTGLERASFEKILAFAHDPANVGHELMHCLDAQGTLVHATSTGRGSAPITPEMQKAIMVMADGSRLWHNHPTQDSLSHCDWRCAGTEEQPEILALNERGSFYVGRIVEWDDRLPELFKWLPRLGRDLDDHLSSLANERGLDKSALADLSKFTGHILNLGLADRISARYAYRLMSFDKFLIDRCSELDIVVNGRTFASEAIDWKLRKLAGSSPNTAGS